MTIPPVIWMYWDQGSTARRAAYLDLCQQTIRRHATGMTVRVLSARTARDVVPDLPLQWEQLTPVHRSDVLRAHLLLRHGGIWLDVDTVALRPIQVLLDAARGNDFVTFPESDQDACTGVILAAPGSGVARAWTQAQAALLQGGSDLDWATLGSHTLMHGFYEHGGTMLPINTVSPIAWRDWELFMSPTYPLERVVARQPVLVSLYNAFMGPMLADVTREQIQRSPRLYARLIRHAHHEQTGGLEALRTGVYPLTAGFARARRSVRFRLRRRIASLPHT